MCQDVFEIVQSIDLSDVEVRLALQCAPVITGIKISNLLTASSEDEKRINDILIGTEIQHYCLFRQGENTIYLLYRRSELEGYLQEFYVKRLLHRYGYQDLSLLGILEILQKRYELYRNKMGGFPHEMGLFLGYPVEDVEGFIQCNGKDYLYAGYWKVYKDVDEKKMLFEAYESAKEGLLILIGNGYLLRPIIEYFEKYEFCSFLNT